MRAILLIFALSVYAGAFSQSIKLDISHGWQFFYRDKWYKATVPGTIHTDLLQNKLIPDPFFSDNEKNLQWIDTADWTYRCIFSVKKTVLKKQQVRLIFDGLDTYADVYLNGTLLLQANNMFIGWEKDLKGKLKMDGNDLLIIFHSAQKKVDKMAFANLPLILPDNNRVYARKAQFQFGWDWGPKYISCGIWKNIRIEAWDGDAVLPRVVVTTKDPVRLIQEKDRVGTSFYFEKNGKPLFIKGANWIPADIFLPRVHQTDYRQLLQMAKDANINMLRVWGGGVYESDAFYGICDELGIMVWQDFMFAGAMYPGDEAFFNNVKKEIHYQVNRLKQHPCIVLWCGNNEIDEAWNNWGWQDHYNLHGSDSVHILNNYKRLFEDSIRLWVNDLDGTRPYIPTSPKFGWGNQKSFTEGDSHYWGLWWGLEDWEMFYTKTGRFVSEYGMQAMPSMNSVRNFTSPAGRKINSPAVISHQKAADGFSKLDHYLVRYFIDSAIIRKLTLQQYIYLSQCLQYYILKNSIAVHISKQPNTMGTMLWQLNDCWPATSWSIIDYFKRKKAGWYAVKKAYGDELITADTIKPKDLKLQKPIFTLKKAGEDSLIITSNVAAKYVYLYTEGMELDLSDNFFDLDPFAKKTIRINKAGKGINIRNIRIMSLSDFYSP